ncbi:MAG TPA: hypothetical protein VM936_14475 [Pyrinomonadaceae bacterium]|nr:hypothetical protein [Pyrinomonadaceae bacterium]
MIIIWKGAGGFVILGGIVVCLLLNIVTAAVYHHTDYFSAHLWPKVAALWITGASCWFLGRYLNGRPPRAVWNRETGREDLVKPNHHLMFIKLEYWGPIFFAIGAGLVVAHLTG